VEFGGSQNPEKELPNNRIELDINGLAQNTAQASPLKDGQTTNQN